MRPCHLFMPIFLLLASTSGAAFAEAGVFQFAAGDVRLADPAGVERAARKGEALNEGDTILTGRDGAAQIKMADGGFISVRANTRLKVDAYTYIGKKDGSEKSFFSLMAGGFRALTGMIGQLNKDNYRINTPSATIGIRGTDHEPMVILPGQQALGEPGTYDKVNAGASFIATAKGVIDINPNQVGFAPGANIAPVILPKIPAFYKESPPVPVGEKMRLEKEQGAAKPNDKGTDVTGSRAREGKGESGAPRDDKIEAMGDKGKPAAPPGKGQAPGTNKAATGLAQPPLTNAALQPANVAPPATGAAPMLAPLPSISTTTRIAPLNTAIQPVVAPITATKPLEPLAAPSSTGTSTAPVKPLDPAPAPTTQPVLTAPTGTLTTQPTLIAPTGTLTTQPILTAPTTTTTTTITSPTLTAPLPQPTAPLIKPLP